MARAGKIRNKSGKDNSSWSVKNSKSEKHLGTVRGAATGRFVEGQVKGHVDQLHPHREKTHSERDIMAVIKGSSENHWQGAVLVESTGKPESQMTTMEKMEATKEGFSKKQLVQLKDTAGLDYDQLAQLLDVARSTLINKKNDERFSTNLSEKIMSLADIYSYGYEVFGGQKEFNTWIFQPIIALGGKAPYELLNNQYGREEVRNIIGRIAYGVYS